MLCFFFSSRRRHTRFDCDWSSDVCSSDLGLGMFRSVNVVLADTTPPAGDSTVRVVVRVSEAPRHRIRAGAGYGSLDCFRVQSGWTAYDFLGGARSLDLTGQLSKLGVGVPANSGFKQNVCHPLHDDPTSDTANYN